MDPENQSEGTAEGGQATAPEDLLFGNDSESQPSQQETQPQPTPEAEPAASEQPGEQLAGNDDAVDDSGSAADALADDGEKSPAEALGSDEGGEDGEGSEPRTYESFEIPEGVDTFTEPVVEALGELANELNLSQEQAQKIVDRLGPAQLQAKEAVVDNANESWVKASRSDKEVGGAQYKPSLQSARRAIDRFATPEFRKLMVGKGTQLVNHPEMLRFLARVGAATSTDRKFTTGKSTPAKSVAKVNVTDPMATQDATADLLFGTVDA